MPGGSTINGQKIPVRNDTVFGPGVYTSKLPLYAQLYAPFEEWRGKFVQTILMMQQRLESISKYGSEGSATTSIICRDDIHRLYGGLIKDDEVQFRTQDYSNIIIQAILLKIHQTKTDSSGGEYHRIVVLLESLDKKQ